jgi:hypothetical protein
VDAGPIPDETENCSPLGRSKLFPIIGAFAGPDPGPCALVTADQSYTFYYDSDSVLTREVAASGQDETEFHYEEGLLVSEKRTQPNGVSTTTYDYADYAVETVTIQPDGSTVGYIYELDERGYVRSARLINKVASGSTPTHYTYEYKDCRLGWRVAYDPNDLANLDTTLQYVYDDRGHLIKRSSNISEEQFDYSCW